MKKLALLFGIVCLMMASCNNSQNQKNQPEAQPVEQQEEQTCDQHKGCPFAAINELFADWDNMDEAAKAEALKAAKAQIDEMEAARCEKGDKPCCKEGKHECENGEKEPCAKPCDNKCEKGDKPCDRPELTEEMKAEMEAKRAEMEAKIAEMNENWANFDNLSADDQKALIESKIQMMKEMHHRGGHHGEKPCCQNAEEKPAE